MVIDSAKGGGAPDRKTDGGLPYAQYPHHHLHQQTGPGREIPPGYPGRNRRQTSGGVHAHCPGPSAWAAVFAGCTISTRASCICSNPAGIPLAAKGWSSRICTIQHWMNCWAARPGKLREDVETDPRRHGSPGHGPISQGQPDAGFFSAAPSTISASKRCWTLSWKWLPTRCPGRQPPGKFLLMSRHSPDLPLKSRPIWTRPSRPHRICTYLLR